MAIGSRVIAASKSFFGAPYSSILPHGVGGKDRLVIATPYAEPPSGRINRWRESAYQGSQSTR